MSRLLDIGIILLILIVILLCPYIVLIFFVSYVEKICKNYVSKRIAGYILYFVGVVLTVFGATLYTTDRDVGSIVPSYIDILLSSIIPDQFVINEFYFHKDPLIEFCHNLVITLYYGFFIVLGLSTARRGRTLLAQIRTLKPEAFRFIYLRPFDSDLTIHGQDNLNKKLKNRNFWNDLKILLKQIPYTSFSRHFRNNVSDRLDHLLRSMGDLEMLQNPLNNGINPGPYQVRIEEDANWQTEILIRIQGAFAAFIHIGVTEGLLWEISQVIKKMNPTKVFLYIPLALYDLHREETQEIYDKFRTLTVDIFPQPLPDYKEYAQFIYFDTDWKPHLLIPVWPGYQFRWPWSHKTKPSQQKILKALSAEFAPSWRKLFIEIAVITIPLYLLLKIVKSLI